MDRFRTEPDDRLAAFGNQLVEMHIRLREQLADLHDNVDAYLAGNGAPPRDLLAHCLSFCTALTRHHRGEDNDAFTEIGHQHPEMRAVLTQLRTDHHHIDWMLGNLQTLLDTMPSEPGTHTTTRIRAELDGITAVLETHFTYEEKKLVPLLNAMRVSQWRQQRPDFLSEAAADGMD